jgi:hypothetical protein
VAHDTGSSYLKLGVVDNRIVGRWEIALHDLDEVLKLDQDGDHRVSAGEIRGRYPAIRAYALDRLKLGADGGRLGLEVGGAEPVLESFLTSTNLVLDVSATSALAPKVLEIEYRLFFESKPQHRGLLLLECRGRSRTAMFSPDRAVQRFELDARTPMGEFVAFGWEGVWHIWIGFDHVLFLIALLLPAVLKREAETWKPVPDFREAFINVFKIVTAFTLAHSITLSLAALELIRLPSRWVEPAIAASVLVAALNNLRPVFRGRAWVVAFGFGLIHGLGFASVLTELGLSRGILGIALVSFNLGVELGQLAIVAVFLPTAFGLRRFPAYPGLLLRFGSIAIALVAGLWMIERVFP